MMSQFSNKNLIAHFAWYLEKEKKYDIETLSIDRLLNWEHFYRKNPAENVHPKVVADPFLILVDNPKQSLHARYYFKNKHFDKGLSEILKSTLMQIWKSVNIFIFIRK